MITKRDALEIADDLLYRTGKGIVTGDFAVFVECFSLPYFVETADKASVMKSEDDLSRVFEDVRNYYKSLGVTDFARTVISVEVLDSNSIGSTHVSRLLTRDRTPLKIPYPTYSVLRRNNNTWKINSSIYAMLDDPVLSGLLTQSDREENSASQKR